MTTGEARQRHPVRTGEQAEDGFQLRTIAGRHEDERLHDLAELGTDGPGRVLGRMRRFAEDGHLEGDALALGGIDDAPNGGVGDRG